VGAELSVTVLKIRLTAGSRKVGHAATLRAGVGNIGELNLRGTLISGNAGTLLGREIFHSTGSVVANFNLFGFNGNSGVVGFLPGANNVVPPAGVVGADILDTLLSNPPGLTQTHTLVAGSPALNAVTVGCPPPATDQRAVTRPQGVACDIGAYELVVVTPTPTPTPTPVDGTCLGSVATITGTELGETLLGSPGADVINALGGDDIIQAKQGNDKVCGGLGNDNIRAGQGSDQIDGGDGTDACDGRTGTDTAVNCETVSNVP